MAAVLFKHAKANNHSFDSIYSIALTLPYFTDTDECIGGEGPFFSAYVEDAVRAKGAKHCGRPWAWTWKCCVEQNRSWVFFFLQFSNGIQYLVDILRVLQPGIVHLLQIVGASPVQKRLSSHR